MALTKTLLEAQIQNQKDQQLFRDGLLELRRQQQDDTKALFEAITAVKKENPVNSYFSAEGIANSITEFKFDPDEGITFPAYFRRFESIFEKKCQSWSDEQKVILVLQKLGTDENNKYTNFVLPRKASDIPFKETIEILSSIFGERVSLFHTRFQCLNMIKKDDEDFVTYAGNVNKICERFLLNELSIDRFKCLIFVQGLTSSKDKDIRSRILTKLEQDSEINLQRITEECQRIMNLKHDNTEIEEKDISRVHFVRPKIGENKNIKKPKCFGCGGLHLISECYFRSKNCFACGKKGHISSHCKGKEKRWRSNKSKVNVVLSHREIEEGQKRKFVNAKINGKSVKLQLDTGSDISIINVETWKRIGCPTLEKSYKLARGVSGRRLNFHGEFNCNISFVGKTLKTKVYVLQNSANLFGTDWIVLFNLWELPINSFCNKINVSNKNRVTEVFVKKLKIKFPEVFSEGMGTCKKTEAKFEMKENVRPVFKQKRNVPFGVLEPIDRELERLEKLGVISRVDFSDWACPTVYVKKKK